MSMNTLIYKYLCFVFLNVKSKKEDAFINTCEDKKKNNKKTIFPCKDMSESKHGVPEKSIITCTPKVES